MISRKRLHGNRKNSNASASRKQKKKCYITRLFADVSHAAKQCLTKTQSYTAIQSTNITLVPIAENPFVSDTVNEAVATFKSNVKYSFVTKGRTINVFISSQKREDYHDLIHKMQHFLCFFLDKIRDDCVKVLNIHLYLTDDKKEIAVTKNAQIESKHINSAFCYVDRAKCMDESHIYVYRKEELFRAFIHECIHIFHIEHLFHKNSAYNDTLNSVYNLETQNLKCEEVVCECFATIYNILFNVYYLNTDSTTRQMVNKFTKFLNNERHFCSLQCSKLFFMWDVGYEELLDFERDRVLLNTDTNVFSYIVLKCIMLKTPNIVKLCYIEKKGAYKMLDFFNTLIKRVASIDTIAHMKHCAELFDENSDANTLQTMRLTTTGNPYVL